MDEEHCCRGCPDDCIRPALRKRQHAGMALSLSEAGAAASRARRRCLLSLSNERFCKRPSTHGSTRDSTSTESSATATSRRSGRSDARPERTSAFRKGIVASGAGRASAMATGEASETVASDDRYATPAITPHRPVRRSLSGLMASMPRLRFGDLTATLQRVGVSRRRRGQQAAGPATSRDLCWLNQS